MSKRPPPTPRRLTAGQLFRVARRAQLEQEREQYATMLHDWTFTQRGMLIRWLESPTPPPLSAADWRTIALLARHAYEDLDLYRIERDQEHDEHTRILAAAGVSPEGPIVPPKALDVPRKAPIVSAYRRRLRWRRVIEALWYPLMRSLLVFLAILIIVLTAQAFARWDGGQP